MASDIPPEFASSLTAAGASTGAGVPTRVEGVAAREAALRDLRGKWWAALVLTGLLLAWLLFAPVGRPVASAVGNVGGVVLAAWWCGFIGGSLRDRLRAAVATADPERRPRVRAWVLCFAGIVSFGIGQVLYYVYDFFLTAAPSPSPADAFYFLEYPFMMAGALLLPLRRTTDVAGRGRVLLDSLMTVVALATFSWYFLMGPILLAYWDAPLLAVVSVAYPVCDLVNLLCVLMICDRIGTREGRWVTLPLSCGMVAMAVVDTVYAYRLLRGSYETGELTDVGWPIALMAIGLAIRAHRLAPLWSEPAGAAAPHSPAAFGWWRSLLPYALLPLMAGLMVYIEYADEDGWLERGVESGTAALLVLIVSRQVLSIRENALLNARLRGAMGELEAGNRSLRASEERFRIAAGSAGDLIYEWDIACGRLDWFGDIDACMGCPPGGFPRTLDAWAESIHPDDRDWVTAALDRHLEGHAGYNVEYRVIRRDGRVLYWSERGVATRGPDGRPVRMVGAVADVTARKEAEARLRHESQHDALTGLPNRALFRDRVERALQRAKRDADFRFAVLFLDLDRFKVVNDSLGHAAGDRLLTGVAERLLARVCVTDEDDEAAGAAAPRGALALAHSVARMGGDEFTILLEGLPDPAHAVRLAEGILADLSRPIEFGGHEIFTAGSIGIVVADGATYETGRDVIRDADAAMYRAKSLGRGRHAVFDATMHAAAVQRLQVETALRRAIERRELLLHYQPIVSLRDRALLGFEALVRWQHDGRLISPADFIPIAEDTGLIVPLGEWVLREASRQLAEWHARFPGLPELFVAVNVSRRQLTDPGLLATVRGALADTRLRPASLRLEITESALVEDDASADPVLRKLKALGVRLEMDDFGTGYSSLSCLNRFPLDGLKIDRSFVSHTTRRDYAAVLQAIITLARNLGMEVVAEGLEQPEQVALLQALDCEYGQGYFFSKPLPADAAETMIATYRPFAQSA